MLTRRKRTNEIADRGTAEELDNLYNAVQAAAVPVGCEMFYAGSTAPDGWQFCNGQSLRKAEYPALFSAIGYRYGTSDGGSSFNLPDRRGLVPIGAQTGVSATYKLGVEYAVYDVGTPASPKLVGMNFIIKV